MGKSSVVKEDLDEVDERYVPTVSRQYSHHGDTLAHRADTDQCCSASVRDRSARGSRSQLIGLGSRLRLWWCFYQLGVFQANGPGHARLPPDHPTPVASRAGHLWHCPRDRATASYYDA